MLVKEFGVPKPIEWRHDHGFMKVLLLGRGFDMRNVRCFFYFRWFNDQCLFCHSNVFFGTPNASVASSNSLMKVMK